MLLNRFLKQADPAVQRFIKGRLFSLNDFFDMHLLGSDFRKSMAHRLGEDGHKFVEERFMETQGAPVADGAAQDTAKNVMPFGVARLNAVSDGKAKSADVVGNNAKSDIDFFL